MLQNEDSQKRSAHIDLLIVISSKAEVSFTELEPILDIVYLKDQHVSCSLHNEGNVLEGLRNGHIFYSLNFIPENLVYDDKALSYPVTSPETLCTIKQLALEKFTGCHDKATDFYNSALSLNQVRSTPITLFMLHQAVELTYRGLLLSLNAYDKKTHEIRVLKKYIRRCAQPLNECFPGIKVEHKLLEILDTAYLRARYEENYAIEDNDLALLFEKVKLLLISSKEFVENVTRKR
jgi:HEPN domain-containing protein